MKYLAEINKGRGGALEVHWEKGAVRFLITPGAGKLPVAGVTMDPGDAHRIAIMIQGAADMAAGKEDANGPTE